MINFMMTFLVGLAIGLLVLQVIVLVPSDKNPFDRRFRERKERERQSREAR
jgi:hypothetical protein